MWNPQSRTVLDSLTWGETYTWYKKKRSQRRNYRLICNGFQQKKLLDRIADIRMIHEMSSAQNALDYLKDYCSNSWTTKPRVQCRLFNRVLKRWTAQLISVILFRWIVIYPVDSAIQPGGGGVLPYKRLIGMCRWMGSHFHDWIDYNGVAFSIEFTRMASHIFGFWGWESCSYLRLANVPEYLYCRWKVKCSSFNNLLKNGSINFRMAYLKDW